MIKVNNDSMSSPPNPPQLICPHCGMSAEFSPRLKATWCKNCCIVSAVPEEYRYQLESSCKALNKFNREFQERMKWRQ